MRLSTLAAKLDRGGAQPILVRGLAHLQAHNFMLAGLDLKRAAPDLPADTPWAADAWQRMAEALSTAVAIGQASVPVNAGWLREAAE